MASFHLNVFFNCPFFSRSIRSMCKESKNKTTTKKQQGKKIDARSTRQPSYLPPLTTLSRGTCKYRDWQVTHAHYSPWFWAQTSPRPALFWRAGLSGKTQLSLQEKPLFPQISVQIQDPITIPDTKGWFSLYLSLKGIQHRHIWAGLCLVLRWFQSHYLNHALTSDETSRTLPLNHPRFPSNWQEGRGKEE